MDKEPFRSTIQPNQYIYTCKIKKTCNVCKHAFFTTQNIKQCYGCRIIPRKTS